MPDSSRRPLTIFGLRAELVLFTNEGDEVRVSDFLRWRGDDAESAELDIERIIAALEPWCGRLR